MVERVVREPVPGQGHPRGQGRTGQLAHRAAQRQEDDRIPQQAMRHACMGEKGGEAFWLG